MYNNDKIVGVYAEARIHVIVYSVKGSNILNHCGHIMV